MEEKEQLLAQVGLHQGDLDQYLEIADYAQEKIYIKFQDAIGRNHYKRRWLYELIQNAVDSDEHNPVNVKVSLFSLEDKWKLEFEHDGGLFKPFDKNLHKGHDFKNFILAKSGKSPTDDRIGKFGTGFLSTHCLANIIKIEGLCLEESGEQKLKSVTLDRTEFYGDDDDSIKLRTLKIVKSLKEYDSSSVEPKDNFPSAKFTYYLTKEGLSNAEEGLKEIDISIQFVLACNPRLKS
ncbi:MAG: hypothetical protein RJQ14_02065, partial [Marinoscillum sp.]